jgi:hypothetical protein
VIVMAVFDIVKYWRSLTAALFDDYHPELHYMRGPGPKCRKRQSAAR